MADKPTGQDDFEYEPSANRWLFATFATAVLAPIPFFMLIAPSPTSVSVLFSGAMTWIMAAPLTLGVTLLPIATGAVIAVLLFRLFKVSSFWVYLTMGTVVAAAFFSIEISGEFRSNFLSRFLNMGLMFGVPSASVFWLFVWWPKLKRKLVKTTSKLFGKAP